MRILNCHPLFLWTKSMQECSSPRSKDWICPVRPHGVVKEENMNIKGLTDLIHQDQQGANGSVWGYGAWWIRLDTGSSSLLFLRSVLERGSRFQPCFSPSTAALLCQITAASTSAGVTWDASTSRCLGLSLTWFINHSNIQSALCFSVCSVTVVDTMSLFYFKVFFYLFFFFWEWQTATWRFFRISHLCQ